MQVCNIQTQVKRNEWLKMQSWQRKSSEMIAWKDWRVRPTKCVLWNICIHLPDKKCSNHPHWSNDEMVWRWTILPPPTAPTLQFPSWAWRHEVNLGILWLQHSDTYSSALLSHSGKWRPALITLQLKQHFIISLHSRLRCKVILNTWLMALKNV